MYPILILILSPGKVLELLGWILLVVQGGEVRMKHKTDQYCMYSMFCCKHYGAVCGCQEIISYC